MASISGISLSSDLSSALASLDESTRFLKISIRDEQLVPDGSHSAKGRLPDDLPALESLLVDNVPAYVLARLDNGAGWLLIDYVPDGSRVRDKMLYASTRGALTRSLPSPPSDTLYATSKHDLSPTSYAAHLTHLNAPKPLSAREKEMEEVKAAERAAGFGNTRPSASPGAFGGSGVGLQWDNALEEAVKALGEADGEGVVTAAIEPGSEKLVYVEAADVSADELGSKVSSTDPSFAFFNYTSGSQPQVVFIYTCPSSSPIKHRMLYSAGAASVFSTAKSLLPPGRLASRKLETSDPSELSSKFFRDELGSGAESAAGSRSGSGTPGAGGGGFAKPRGPARRAR
ncbi:actin depolymerizing protein [Peniophora sp. CONT]|nr:actin depolymerizing protein [Peniophora sp. CONT]